jgi:hypothetical protein
LALRLQALQPSLLGQTIDFSLSLFFGPASNPGPFLLPLAQLALPPLVALTTLHPLVGLHVFAPNPDAAVSTTNHCISVHGMLLSTKLLVKLTLNKSP